MWKKKRKKREKSTWENHFQIIHSNRASRTWLFFEKYNITPIFMLCRVIFLIRSHLSPLPFSSLKQQPSTTPICMFYFAHPFGISTPSSTATTNIEAAKKKSKKSTKYTTTTYLVTEIQKNVDESSQDECCDHSKSSYAEQDMLPWPQSLLLPPPIIQQLIEKRKGKTRRESEKNNRAEGLRARSRSCSRYSFAIEYPFHSSNKWEERRR